MQNIKLKIAGMHCSSCSMRIDGDLEELDGIQAAQTNFAKGESNVEFDETHVSLDQIKNVIQQAGYQVVG